jgi:methionine-S-sulfoxide reductase
MPGVIRTRVGYAGGEKSNPTYTNLGNHTETIQIDYDPQRIGYGQLLEVFWLSHDPTVQSPSTQYRSILFFHDDEQKRQAEESRRAWQESNGQTIVTDFREAGAFWRAEDYHQKYSLRRHGDLLRELTAVYPKADDLTDSTVAARLNGFMGGNGTAETLCEEIDDYGLSPQGREKLLVYVTGVSAGCPD